DAVADDAVAPQIVVTPEATLPVIIEMAVEVALRLVTEQNEEIRVAPEREVGFGFTAEALVRGKEPALDSLPRWIVPVKLICAVRPIAVRQQKAARAERGFRGGQ